MYAGEERRKDPMGRRIHDVELRLKTLEGKVDENFLVTTGIFKIIGHATSFFTVLGWIGHGIKWVAGVATAVSAIVGAVWLLLSGKGPGGPS